MGHPRGGRAQHHGDDGERDDPERQVDVEDPAPAGVVDDEPADQRARDAGEAEHRAEVARVAAPLPRGDDIGDDRLRADHQPAATDALQGPERDELPHVLRQPAQGRADQEHHDREQEDLLAAVEVAELAVDRRRDGRGQQVGRHHPRQLGEPAQLADDRRQRRRDDRLVERGQHHGQHQPCEDRADAGRCRLLRCYLCCHTAAPPRRVLRPVIASTMLEPVPPGVNRGSVSARTASVVRSGTGC